VAAGGGGGGAGAEEEETRELTGVEALGDGGGVAEEAVADWARHAGGEQAPLHHDLQLPDPATAAPPPSLSAPLLLLLLLHLLVPILLLISFFDLLRWCLVRLLGGFFQLRIRDDHRLRCRILGLGLRRRLVVVVPQRRCVGGLHGYGRVGMGVVGRRRRGDRGLEGGWRTWMRCVVRC
jgi:hypothetical protein